MPSHNHRVKSSGGGNYIGYAYPGYPNFGEGTENTGGGESHNNIPPTVSENVYRRVA